MSLLRDDTVVISAHACVLRYDVGRSLLSLVSAADGRENLHLITLAEAEWDALLVALAAGDDLIDLNTL